MAVRKSLAFSFGILMTICSTYGQSLFFPRAVALGGNGASVRDTRGFESNPASLVGMRDWEFSTATYSNTAKATGFVFHGITFGKRLLENQAIAVKFSPGSLLEFTVPSQFTSGSGTPRLTDRKLSYAENFAVGFAHRFSDQLSSGLGIRFLQQEINDKIYELIPDNGNNIPKVTEKTSRENVARIDLAVDVRVNEAWNLSLLGRNLLGLRTSTFSSEFSDLALSVQRAAEVSARYRVSHTLALLGSASTKLYGAVGGEYLFPGIHFTIRGSVYYDKDESPFLNAASVGLGWHYGFLEVDMSYLRFLNQDSRRGIGTAEIFNATEIQSVELNRYTPDRVSFSVKAILGNIRESLARIEGVEISSAIYPSSYELLAFRPIGKVRVKNISDKPINAKASFYIEKYMDAPTETPAVYMLPGEEKDIPFNAVLNEQVKSVNTLTVREGNVYVNATPAEEYDDKAQTKVLIHGKNDWDGDVHTLRHFVTPDDPAVLRYTRDILFQFRDSLAGVSRELEQLVKARLLFNAFAGNLVYVGDPKKSSDYVQYPSETLTLRSGDCDDMTACFASLLSSVGVSTAFVDVVPPGAPERNHISMMFDTGVEARLSARISENAKRYVIRKNVKGMETVWLPIETTAITEGFDAAWNRGAEKYFDEVEVQLGLIKGWVKIVDVN